MWFQFSCECSSHSRMGPGCVGELSVHTKDYEASVRIRGAQRILGRAAIHWAVELGWHSLQNQLLPLSLSTAIQQAAPHSRPGEEGLGEHLILSTPSARMGWRGEKEKEREKRDRRKERRREGVRGWCRERLWVSAKRLRAKDTWIIQAPIFPLMQWQVNNMH